MNDVPTVHVGVIEWDGSQSPSVFVATTREGALRQAFKVLAVQNPQAIADDPEFISDNPPPSADNAHAVETWLDLLREATTEPWFTHYEVAVMQ